MSRRPPGIDLWRIDLDRLAADGLDPATVTSEERAAADRIRTPLGGSRLLARRSATRTLLADLSGTDVGNLVLERSCPTCGSTEHGRPSVHGAPFVFSVSSTNGLAVIAVSEGPVGVDIERVPLSGGVLPTGMTPHEQERLAEAPPDRRLAGSLRLWTAKEAVLKAGGRSLTDDPTTIEVADLLAGDTVTVSDGDRTWVVRLLHDDRSAEGRAVVAVADSDGGPITWRTGRTGRTGHERGGSIHR